MFTGAERLAKEFDIPLVYASINRIKRGYYEVHFKVLEEDPKNTPENDITNRFYDKLEAAIHKDRSIFMVAPSL